ncbi:MAG: Na+/H+ antiporter NhaC family protein [Blastocatellia bacterium]|nr:Na+/H+ antiporter NhaC family protein [Blastocatellia bacterium]
MRPISRQYLLRSVFCLSIFLFTATGIGLAQEAEPRPAVEVQWPALTLVDVDFALTVKLSETQGWPSEVPFSLTDERTGQPIPGGSGQLAVRDEDNKPKSEVKIEHLRLPVSGVSTLVLQVGDAEPATKEVRAIPGWLSLLPPLIAIGLAMLFRQVIVALFAGVWLGAVFVHGYQPFVGFLRAADYYAVNALTDRGHASIVIFSLLLGGMIGVVAKSGGAMGMANLVTRFATTSKRGQFSSWLLGILIFFDDYSNTLIVGSTMRPITDRLRVSREKLAFIVDATAAPVASIAVISSWIGVEIGYIGDQYKALGLEGDPYLVFLQTIPLRFYPLLMLFFGLMVVFTRRDFGPMWRAERRAREEGKLLADGANPAADFADPGIAPKEGRPLRWYNAVVPILVVILTILIGMYLDGRASVLSSGGELNLRNIFGAANSNNALIWASLLGCVAAILMAVGQRLLSLAEAMGAWLTGLKSIVLAILILVLAWSLGSVCVDLHTANYIISAIGGWLNPALLPVLVFLISAVVSFATGTSWGTMAILFPLIIPLAHNMAPGQEVIMLGVISSVLAGSVWGDHCSPISDTTIMSSMASSCDHIDHVRTQLPYALSIGFIGMLVGDLPTAFGLWNEWVALLLGMAVITGMLFLFGKKVDEYKPPT